MSQLTTLSILANIISILGCCACPGQSFEEICTCSPSQCRSRALLCISSSLLHPNLVWVSVSFLSAFKASGEKIGSFGSFASSLTSKLCKVAEGDNLHRLRRCLVGMPTPFLEFPAPKKLTTRNAVWDKQTILSPFIELTN